jgi:MFS transporter, UMF1 family
VDELVDQKQSLKLNRSQFSWAIYDFANSAFATTVMAGFFPIFFKQYWAKDLKPTESTFILGAANSMASLCLVLLVLTLGRKADRLGKRKLFLCVTTLIGSLATASFYLIPESSPYISSFVYFIAALQFALSIAFYDSLLVEVAGENELDWVSGVGYSLGYLGGGLLFLLNVFMTLSPQTFGLSSAAEAVKISFVSVSVWWIVFMIPLLLFTKERPHILRTEHLKISHLWSRLKNHKPLGFFLLGFLFYNDAVNTIIKMAVDYGSALGFESTDLIPAALVMSLVGKKLGPLNGIYICIGVYILATLFAQQMTSSNHFYALAALIGLVQGGIQSLSRSYYARFVPEAESATYFGLFNLSGKFSAVVGPVLMGALALITDSSRASLFVVIAFFFIGLVFLKKSQSS